MSNRTNLIIPAANAFAITPNDSNNLTNVTRAIFVGGAGNLAVEMEGGQSVTLTGVVVGTVYSLRLRKVKSTGTTATNLVGLY